MKLTSMIGHTPLVELEKINPYKKKVRLLAKFEGANPGGSVKDRPAWYMIKAAEEDGTLTRDKIIIEPTSGNTGIALGMIAAARGYKIRLYMPACVSHERRMVLEAFGAEVVLTPAEEKTDGAIIAAKRALEEGGDLFFMPNQYNNPYNALAHFYTTGPEIYQQTGGDVTVFAAGMGTTGTLMGTGRYLKEQNPEVKIVGVEPVPGHTVQGLKNMEEAIIPQLYNPGLLDEKIQVADDEAFGITRELITREGLFVGMSSGAAVAGALKVASQLDSGTVVTILPDRGDRYLSTFLFKSFCARCRP